MAHFVFLLLLAVAAVTAVFHEILSLKKTGGTVPRISLFALVSAAALIIISILGIAESAAI